MSKMETSLENNSSSEYLATIVRSEAAQSAVRLKYKDNFMNLKNVFSSSEEDISRVDGTRTGREIPGGASGYPLWRSASREERQQPVSQPDEPRNCREK